MSEGEKKVTKEIIVSVDSKEMKELMEELHEERANLKTERAEKEDLREKLVMIGEIEFARKKKELNAPDSITNPKALLEWQIEQGEDAGESGTGSNIGSGSSGRSRLQSQSGKKTFTSHKDLVNHLTGLEIEQNPSNNPESDSEAKKTKDALWEKYVNALKRREIHQPVQYIPEDEKSDEPIIGKYIENVNKRKKALVKGEK